jgi:signal transduction histidine kinase
LNAFKRFIKTIPAWAFALVLLAIFVISVYLWARSGMQMYGATFKSENDYYIVDYVQHGGPIDKAGIRSGDTVVSLNLITLKEWENKSYIPGPGDTVIFGILRNNQEIQIPIVILSVLEFTPWLFWSFYIIMAIISIASLFLLYKKPADTAVRLFFLYIQGFVIISNAQVMSGFYQEPIAMIASSIFLIIGCFLGPFLMHFHLLFPKPSELITRFGQIPIIVYIIAALLGIGTSVIYVNNWIKAQPFSPILIIFLRITIWWYTVTFLMALATAIYQFKTIKDTLSRNQLLIVLIGASFSCITPVAHALFWDHIFELNQKILFLVPLAQGLGGLIMIGCFLVAIFRYRIWNIEVFIRKALLYLGAALVIVLSYLFLLFLVDRLTITETKITRFIALAISVIIFLVLRDWIQRLIERIFHREAYDTATVVSNFEEKMAGIYRIEDLGSKIVKGLDEIFHFRTFMMNLKEDGMKYEIVSVLGMEGIDNQKEIEINEEFENKLARSRIFSPGELDIKPSFLEKTGAELVVPLLKEDKPYGFLMCGPKKSEKAYSMQDIRVLSLIAKRLIALFHTASLYQKDLDRQLMLERERARISQDMHDDIGAGLTKIAMISEAGGGEQGTVSGERMLKVATTAREMINRLNVIVWALNPRYDNLDSLVSYARRYFGEYLENFGIRFRMEVPDEIPDIPVTPDFRRNAFYAWQEAIHNAVKHGACSEVKIEVTMNGQTMQVIITDNGKGFDQARSGSGGNGLLNMKKRAEDLGGSFQIQSQAGKGTRVEFWIPVGG